jgi:beta-lactamase class C
MAGDMQPRRLFHLSALAALVLVPAAAAATPAPDPGTAIAAAVAAYQKATHTPGVAVAVFDTKYFGSQGKIYTFGVTSTATKAKVAASTVFQIGSVTKVYDTTLLAVAYGKHYASKTTTAYSALKGTKGLTGSATFKTVTLDELGSHRGGFPDSAPGMSQADQQLFSDQPPPARLVSYWNSFTTQNKPGSCYLYSDTGFITLGYAIAASYPAPLKGAYNQILKTEINTPLGQSCTSGLLVSGCTMATGYHDTSSGAVPVKGVALDIKSNANDMLKFLEANLFVGPVTNDPTLVAALKTVQAPLGTYKVCGKSSSVTLGLAWQDQHLTSDTSSPVILIKNGATPLGGMSDAIVLIPSLKIGALVLTNGINDSSNAPKVPAGQPGNPTALTVAILRQLVSPSAVTTTAKATPAPRKKKRAKKDG